MNKQEAYRILTGELRILAELPFTELEAKLGSGVTVDREDSSGIQYQVETEIFRNSKVPDAITIRGTVITTGQWHFAPVTEQINVKRT